MICGSETVLAGDVPRRQPLATSSAVLPVGGTSANAPDSALLESACGRVSEYLDQTSPVEGRSSSARVCRPHPWGADL